MTILRKKTHLLFVTGVIATGLSLGVLAVVSGAFKEAKSADDYRSLGDVASDEGHYLRAIEYYEKSIELDPGIAEVYKNLGLAYETMADYRKAVQNYGQAIELGSDYAEAYYNRARAYNPDEVYSMSSLGWYMERGTRGTDLDTELQAETKSLEDYLRAIELDPSYLQRVPCGASALWTLLKEGGNLEQAYASAQESEESYFGHIAESGGGDLADEDFASWSPDGNKIAFVRRETSEKWDIWVLDVDTGDRTRLTSTPVDEYGPAWSPDGKTIAYNTEESETEGIWIVNSDGSDSSELLSGPGGISSLSWSPDGEKIAFYWVQKHSTPATATPENCPRCSSGEEEISFTYEIWIMNDDGGDARAVAHDADFSGFSWSPDGKKIAYAFPQPEVAEPASRQIFVVDIDTNQRFQGTSGNTDNIEPVWSPDGETIIFRSKTLGVGGHGLNLGDYAVCLMNDDGSDTECYETGAGLPYITDFTWYEWNLAEKSITYVRHDGLWIIDLKDGGRHRIQFDAEVKSNFGDVSWSPNRRRMAFGGSDSGHRIFYVAAVEERATPNTTMPSGPTCTSTASMSAPPNLPTDFIDKIAFESDRAGNEQIYSMNADGTGLARLTTTSASDMAARWSPDGQTIAFQSNRDGDWEVYVMAADGSYQVDLSQARGDDFLPAWSPDGSLLAFTKADSGDNWEIYLMNTDGTGQTRLTSDPAKDGAPAWSPDGSKIAFFSDRDGNWEIYVMNADGTGETRLTSNPATDGAPDWSPDGSRIAFFSDRDGNNEIYVMNADGTGQTRLTNDPAKNGGPAWSPDGSRIAFTSDRDGNSEIYVMNADGSNQTNITNNPADEIGPDWSPVSPSTTTEQTTATTPSEESAAPTPSPMPSPEASVTATQAVGGVPMFRGNPAHTGVNPGSGVERSPKLLWRFETAAWVVSSPAVVDGVVYVGSWDGQVYAIDAATGDERWRFQTSGYVSSSPAVVDGVVYIGSGAGYV